MKLNRKSFFATFMLLVLFSALLPMEGFHQHEEPTVVCHQAGEHVETPSFDCELCDFVLPVFQQQNSADLRPFVAQVQLLSTAYSFVYAPAAYDDHFGRGPPLLA
ncbi:MAG: hypothetical protein RIC95_13030 [Vicingaceae bacterium]